MTELAQAVTHYEIRLENLQEDLPGTLRAMMGALAMTGRVFRAGESFVLISRDAASYSGIKPTPKGIHSLLASGLLQITQAGRPLPLATTRDRILNEVAVGFSLTEHTQLLPELESVTYLPTFVYDGDKLIPKHAGYDAITKTLYVQRPGWCDLPEPDPHYPYLRQLYSGLLFADPVYEANLIAVILGCFVRHATRQFPVILFDTLDMTGKSAGKTTTVRSLMRLITGAEPTPMVHTGSETDLQKDIASFTDKPGPTPIFIDNIRPKSGQQHTVRHQLLKIATNSRVLYLRPHYKGLTPLFEPIFLLTMNGGRVENDLADSVVRVSLRRRKGDVQHRLLKPNPEEYVQENRLDLMAEIFDILSKVQIEPLDQQTFHTRFYRWEEIAIKAARIAGFDPSFSPARVHNADAVVHQLYRLLQDINFEETSFGELATRIPSTGHSSELQNLLSTQGLSPTGRVRFLGDYIEDSIAGRLFRIGPRTFKFVVRNEDKNRFISVEHL